MFIKTKVETFNRLVEAGASVAHVDSQLDTAITHEWEEVPVYNTEEKLIALLTFMITKQYVVYHIEWQNGN